MNISTWNQLTTAEIDHLERTYDGPITDQAVADLIAARRPRTYENVMAECKAALVVVQGLAADLERYRAKGNDKAVDAWTIKLAFAWSRLDALDDEVAEITGRGEIAP